MPNSLQGVPHWKNMLEIKKGILSGVLNVNVVALTWPKTFRWLNCAQAKQIKNEMKKFGAQRPKKGGNMEKRENARQRRSKRGEKRVQRRNRWGFPNFPSFPSFLGGGDGDGEVT